MSNPAVMMYVPFALSGTRNTIQVTRQENQDPEDATLTSGFPDVTMIPESNGGIAPKGQDFNGIFYLITADTVHRQTGKRIQYDATYAKNINGYAKGAILQSTTLTKEYISTVDGNLTDPDSSQSSGWSVYAGAGSVPTATASISGTVKIVDNLVSTNTDTALSANQGRLLDIGKVSKTDLVDNLTSNATWTAPTANQVRVLNENKLDKTTYASTQQRGIVQLVDNFTGGGSDKAITAEAIKTLFAMFSTGADNIRIPRADDLSNPWVIQFGFVDGIKTGDQGTRPFNFPFPNRAIAVFGSQSSFGNESTNSIHLAINDKNGYKYWVKKVNDAPSNDFFWLAIGY